MQWQAWLGGEGGYGTRNEKLPLLKGFQYCGNSREKVVAVFSLYSRMLSGRRFFCNFSLPRGRPYSAHAVFWPFLTPSPPLHASARIWLTPPLKVRTQDQYPPQYVMWVLFLKLSKSFYNENDLLFLVHKSWLLTS